MKPSPEKQRKSHNTSETSRMEHIEKIEDIEKDTSPLGHRRSSRKTSVRVKHKDVK